MEAFEGVMIAVVGFFVRLVGFGSKRDGAVLVVEIGVSVLVTAGVLGAAQYTPNKHAAAESALAHLKTNTHQGDTFQGLAHVHCRNSKQGSASRGGTGKKGGTVPPRNPPPGGCTGNIGTTVAVVMGT